VTSMNEMFRFAEVFNGNIASWDVSSVTTLNRMLWKATSFNQNLCAWGDHIPNFVPVRSMFSSTQCPTTDSPDLKASPPGPFCHPCL